MACFEILNVLVPKLTRRTALFVLRATAAIIAFFRRKSRQADDIDRKNELKEASVFYTSATTLSALCSISIVKQYLAPHSPEMMETESQAILGALGTPKFDPDVHKSSTGEHSVHEDSFVGSINTRSPQESGTNDGWRGINWDGIAEPRARSDSLARIEDPLEAIDALEAALEEVGEALPIVDDHGLDSPIREGSPVRQALAETSPNGHPKKKTNVATSGRSSALDVASQRANGNGRLKSRSPQASRVTEQTPKAQVPSNSKPGQTSTTRAAHKVASRGASGTSATSKSSQLSMSTPERPRTATPKANKLNTAPLSTSRPGFVPAKSTKPLTRPTFELPGEAISRRMKAQREERRKKEEEELQRRRAFRASKIRYSTVPSTEVRETFTSRSRANRGAEESSHILPDEGMRSNFLVSTRTSSLRTSPGEKSFSRHPEWDERLGRRESFVRPGTRHSLVSRSSSLKDTLNTAGINGRKVRNSMINVNPSALKTDIASQKSRGAEISGRHHLLGERERERREKEEIAKRARAEAAERGRRASREWAERQKQKSKMAKQSEGSKSVKSAVDETSA
ncbi:hypothetical protein PRK78_001062 [Emydomyces testavorans]|uniref:Uncharacterized protein n=1 Tax=Emydomyces testavorans TaxID=2070801 RepID=A0AAF0IGH1_9EURO|nr:hypothetical protein PRK78_001062 [Emydomyces testavorans]